MATTARITRDDIEAKLREVTGDLDERAEQARPKLVAGAIAVAVIVAIVAYLVGRGSGRKRSALVEIRRI